MPDEILTPDEVSELLIVTTKTLARWRSNDEGPAWFRLGDGDRNHIRYRRAAIEDWINAREAHEDAQRERGE